MRRLYLVCIGTSIALVLVGWIVSLRLAIGGDVTEIREGLDTNLEKAGEGLNRLEDGASDYSQNFSQSLQRAKESYEENQTQP